MFFFYLYFIMNKTPISWIELINEKIKQAKNQGKAAGVMDVMPEAKSDWKKIKDGSHPKHVQGKSSIGVKTKKRGKKGNKKTKRCRKGCIRKSRCAKIIKTRKQKGGVGIVGYNKMAHIGASIDGERPPVGATGEFYDEVDEKAVHPFPMYAKGGGKRRKRNTKKQRGGTNNDPTSVPEGNAPVEADAGEADAGDLSEVKTADDQIGENEPEMSKTGVDEENKKNGDENVADTSLNKPGHENKQNGGYKKRRNTRKKNSRKNNSRRKKN